MPSQSTTAVVGQPATTISPWPALLVAATVSGAVPAVWNLTLLGGLYRSAYLIVYFALNVVLPAGAALLVTMLRPRVQPAEIVFAALGAGLVEVVLELAVIPHIMVNGTHLTVATEDYIARGAIFCFFAAGGLYGLTRHPVNGTTAPADLDRNRRRDLLVSARNLLGVIGGLISVYRAYKQI
jgi:hypothetical protein